MTNILSLLIVIPLAGLVPLFLFRRDERAAKQVAITTTLVELAVSLWMLTQFHVGEAGFQLVERVEWLPSLGISYLVANSIGILLGLSLNWYCSSRVVWRQPAVVRT